MLDPIIHRNRLKKFGLRAFKNGGTLCRVYLFGSNIVCFEPVLVPDEFGFFAASAKKNQTNLGKYLTICNTFLSLFKY